MVMNNDSHLFMKPKGSDDWYTPQRDILRVWPSCIVRGAAFAVDPSSDIYHWYLQQEGINGGNAVEEMRKCLAETLVILGEARSAGLAEVLTADRVKFAPFKALMFGAGIVMFNSYNHSFREARLTEVRSGSVSEPTMPLDNQRAVAMFDSLVAKARE